jgi:hypothetical protein
VADTTPSEVLSRRHPMFPVLTDAEIACVHRFGTVRRFSSPNSPFGAGASPGL